MTEAFLKDCNRNSIAINDNNGVCVFVKVVYNDDIRFIYKQRNYHRNNLNLGDNLDFLGLYQAKTKTFYCKSSYDTKLFDMGDVNCACIEDIKTTAIEAISGTSKNTLSAVKNNENASISLFFTAIFGVFRGSQK